MTRETAAVLFTPTAPDGRLLYQEVYVRLRQMIMSGTLRPGDRLPSTRALARDLAVSRNTVLRAFELLQADGLLDGKVGAGSYVPRGLVVPASSKRDTPRHALLSARGRMLARLPTGPEREPLPLTPTVPALEEFPLQAWRRITTSVMRSLSPHDLAYGDPAGDALLREAVAQLLASSRGIAAGADQIVITCSGQHGLDLALRALVDPGEAVLIEEPSLPAVAGAVRATGAVPRPLDEPSDERVVCLTPSGQYPTGNTMPLAERREWVAWAERRAGWVIEEDYESDLCAECDRIPALHTLAAQQESVVYVSSFSRTLFPSLRIGFMVIPRTIAASVIAARSFIDRQPAAIAQMVLQRFIAEGHYGEHLRRMRALYAERRDAICAALHHELGAIATVQHPMAALHLLARLPDDLDDRAIAATAHASGLGVEALSPHCATGATERGLVIGFGNVPAGEARTVVARLARAIQWPRR